MSDRACAFAPASSGNIASGFDLLGYALSGVGDRVTVQRIDEPIVRIDRIGGVVTNLPTDVERNTAGRAVDALRTASGCTHGFALTIEKGIPLGSGLGGSAASAVAALVAANALLREPLARADLYPFALEGESASTGAKHGDNVGPQLLGGIVMTTAERCYVLPSPADLWSVVVHPDFVLETRTARAVLAPPYSLSEFVTQSAGLGQLLVGLYHNDRDALQRGLRDVLVEPRRAALIPGFTAVKQAALDGSALGCSISGAGPSVFAWCVSQAQAEQVGQMMQAAFAVVGLHSTRYVGPLAAPGARLVQNILD